jgi:hypothetical protein
MPATIAEVSTRAPEARMSRGGATRAQSERSGLRAA